MCSRYTVRDTQAVQREYGAVIKPSYNVAPSQDVVVVTDKAETMKWHYSPTWAKEPMNLINARSETLREKPSFKMAERCLIVADGWYEWLREGESKEPYFFHMSNKVFNFAGIYTEYQGVKGCAIITKEANEKLSKIHHRMPVMLKHNEGRDWLKGKDVYSSSLSERVEYYPVDKIVNSPRNNDERCVEEIKLV
ncbi:SOS response-associated peptidase [SAR86 cluster bacterium]|nr:SOS response-associated peptidase [SAR86 cluster bacterium]